MLAGSILELIASIKFHQPSLLADAAWLTYGRVRPAFVHCLIYGFCIPAGMGVGLWLLARLGRTLLVRPWMAAIGGLGWNLGVLTGLVGILLGDRSGFENLEMPYYSVLVTFASYLLIGIAAVATFHQRRERAAYVSQWFLLTAIFWFPWVYSTAELLLVIFPVRGVVQAVISWWFSANLLLVWFGLLGLSVLFYFVPKLSARALYSRYLALFAYWSLVLFGSWTGVPSTAPVPAWIPVASLVATALTLLTLLAVGLNLVRSRAPSITTTPGGGFVQFSAVAFLAAGVMRIGGALFDRTQNLGFTWFATATDFLQVYGFLAMAIFGAAYYILPLLMGTNLPWPRLVRVHFWLAAVGVLIVVVPYGVGGVLQSLQLANPNVALTDLIKSGAMFLRLSTVGDLLILLGHGLFLANGVGLVARFYRARVVSTYAELTANLEPAGVES